jgi:signal transduction histidine kinase
MAVAAVLILVVVWAAGAGAPDQHFLAVPVAIGFAGPLAVRRSYPMAAMLCSASTALLQALSQETLIAIPFSPTSRSIVPMLVLLTLAYSAGAWLDTGQSSLCIAFAWALLLVAAYLPGGDGSAGPADVAQSLLYTGIMIVPGWIAGRLAQRHRRQAETFHQVATSLVADRDRRLSEAVAAERARIGAELQDIIAHAVSVMVVQASGARLILQSDPERARASIIHVERAGREALQDLRRLVGLLRAQADTIDNVRADGFEITAQLPLHPPVPK